MKNRYWMNRDIKSIKSAIDNYIKNSFAKTSLYRGGDPDDYIAIYEVEGNLYFKYSHISSKISRSSWSEEDDCNEMNEFNIKNYDGSIRFLIGCIVPRMKSEFVEAAALAVRSHIKHGSDGYRSSDYYTSYGYDKYYISFEKLFEVIENYLRENKLFREKGEYSPTNC